MCSIVGAFTVADDLAALPRYMLNASTTPTAAGSVPSGPLRKMRDGAAAMVFQDPRSSINPLYRVGGFPTEAMRTNCAHTRRKADSRPAELLESVGISDPGDALRRWPHEFSGGML
ncbi:hypothetical protein [Streptomyces sp. NPDC057426]|uniref:hypothetical protein n=1 Tax=Streptomyces sp. NPDC057426 TaxID=3346128 RepID=UPI00367D6911